MQRRSLIKGLAAFGVAPAFVRAQGSREAFKFNLGWKVEAPAAGFLLAHQRGYYRDAGLDVAIDTGNGSASAISLVAGGAYDCASADLATMIEFNVANPASSLRAVCIQYDLNPNAIIVRKGGPIAKPSDLAGKDILGQPFNASRKLFPVFAKSQGIDMSGIKWENVAPDIGDTRFAKGDFDAAAYFYFTGLLNLKSRGIPLDQLTVFRFSDYGMKSYGNGLVVSNKTTAQRPEALAAFVKATTRGWIETIADPRAGAAAIKSRERLANEQIELERLGLIIDGTMKTPDTAANGWGAATPVRMQATIDETVDAFALKGKPTLDESWTDRFLPSAAERRLKS
ncbi:ABC transporter substrate-binding protein [soil metagenome]